jgi:hypothetical protein
LGGVAACGIELSGGVVQDDKTAASSSSSSGGGASGSSSGASDTKDAGQDAPPPTPDATPDVAKPPQYKWRCADMNGKASFGDPVSCNLDFADKCKLLLPNANSDCGKLGEDQRTCPDLCLAGTTYGYNRICICGP